MKLGSERLKRYLSKFELIEERTLDLNEWMQGLSSDAFEKDKKTRLASFKAMQEIAEASFDVCSMLLKDLGKIVEDDYSNIEKLSELKILSEKTSSFLKEANGLRNRFVHEYDSLETKTAFNSIKRLLPLFSDFVKEAKKWIK